MAELDYITRKHLFCLNCGCGMVGEKDTNCPVCNKPVKVEKVANVPFGEKTQQE